MGNRITKVLDNWGLKPRKSAPKRSTRTAPPAASPRKTADAHVYDPVAAEPEYAKVNKKKKTEQPDQLHYAEIRVLQSSGASRPKPTPASTSTTEYATIDFLKGAKTNSSTEPADIMIPPGELRRPVVKSKSVTSKQGVMA